MKYRNKAVLTAVFFLTLVPMISATTFDFVTCGQNGRSGPSQSDCNPYYSGNNDVNVVGSGIQEWTVPQSGVYEIKAFGPSGLNQNPSEAGEGAIIQGKFELDAGETLRILPGQQSAYSGSREWFGGSGGTFVADSGNNPLIVAGGGAGHRTDSYYSKMRANTATWANDGCNDGSGGRDGEGGYLTDPNEYSGYYFAGGGAGFVGNGDASPDDRFDQTTQSESFVNGGLGGYHVGGDTENSGGFGGGGGAGWGDAGGAGGYSGGGPNEQGYTSGCGGGGGSFIHSSASNAATSDGSFSTTGSEPHSTYSGGVSNLNNWHRGSGKVEITLITNPDDPVIRNVNFNTDPGNPATIDGSFDVDIDHDGGNAPNNELESCTVTATGLDSGGQSQSGNINGDSCSFSFNNNQNNWNPDEELRITMEVEDSYGGTDQLTQFEQFPFNPPNAPDSPQPTDGEQTVDVDHDLQVRATHPDGFDMEVRFYLDDGDGFSQVGPTRTAQDGETVSVSPPLDLGTEYTWKASATKQGRTEESEDWGFTTNHRPEIDSVDLSKSPDSHGVDVSYTVSDEDGQSDISECSMTVEDGDGDTLTRTTNPDGGVCDFGEVNHEDRDGWSHLAELSFDLSVEDQLGYSDSVSRDMDLPNHRPNLDRIEVQNYPDRNAFEVSAGINYVDNGTSEIRSCTVVVDDGDQSYSAGNLEIVGSTARCVQKDIGPSQFPGITLDEEITITVRTTDIHGSTVERKTFYNVPTTLQYEYSSVVLQAGGVDYIDYRVVNQAGVESTYRTELKGVNASFSPSGNETIEYNLSSGESNTYSIEVLPDSDVSGRKYLNVTTENLDTGITKDHSIPVGIYQPGKPPAQPVPGPGATQFLVLVMVSVFIYWRRYRADI